MKRTLILTMLVVGMMATGSARAADRIDRDYHETFEVSPGARLELEHGDGEVVFTVWDRDVIEVDVVYRADLSGIGLGSRSDFEVRFEQKGPVVRIEGKEPDFKGIAIFGRMNVEYRYSISAPSYVELDLSGEDGDVEIEGWRAPIFVRLDDGDLALRDIEADRVRVRLEDGDLRALGIRADLEISADDGDVDLVDCAGGPLNIDVEDGDVVVRRCSADVVVTADDGNVRISQLESGSVDIRLQDGDLNLDLRQSAAPDIAVRSDDGDLEVTFAPGLDAEIDISHGDGRVRLDLETAKLEKTEHQVRGRVGSGENPGRVRISTQDGNVTVRSSGG